MCNRKNNSSLLKKKSSRYRGVSFHASNRTWRARIKIAGKSQHLGYWPSEALAGEAYDRAAIRLLGEKANLNFPESYSQEEKDQIKIETNKFEQTAPTVKSEETNVLEKEPGQLWKVLLPAHEENLENRQEQKVKVEPGVDLEMFNHSVADQEETEEATSASLSSNSSASWDFELDGIFDYLPSDDSSGSSTSVSTGSSFAEFDSPYINPEDVEYLVPSTGKPDDFFLDDDLLGALTAL